ncbi:HlyD family efflux transporter periplasmic adaptor subunit [Simiduia curdlanivorans]|uniref:HlyD family secretion protein n=1 Tax=Simiduia curdlanivorans TaxID=1492769 RepID=A0ABV8V5D1_9GAMM|nr:HlyD family efflux transporter periplasmic adaptor subunit [Simiduia curdlanivorans]MDN3640711.1 HlyD family efflux transporter periplasmic adaptor subunit [Simiduia curdlanivorans]
MSLKLIWPLFLLALIGCSAKTPSALGTLERDRVLLTATANEIIVELTSKEGQFINAGEVLVKLDAKRQTAMVARAQAEQARAEAYLLKLTNGERPEDIASAQADVERTTSAFEEARTNFHRLDKLVVEKLVSVAARDTAKARKDETEAMLNSSIEQLNKLIKGVRHEDIVQAQAALAATKAELQLQQQILNDLTVVATRSGILDSLPYNLGERVNTGAILAAIQADNAPFARVYIPEPYRANLVIGDKRPVRIDGIEESLTGKLRWIATEPSFTPYYALNETDRARLMYLAEFDLIDTDRPLPTGLPVSVELSH